MRESWADTRENRKVAKSYGEGVAERLAQRGERQERLTMEELVSRYIMANDHWRPMSVRNVTARLKAWLDFAGRTFPADLMTAEMLDVFRASLRKTTLDKTNKPMVANQVAHHAAEVKHLFRFARSRKLIAENPLADYTIRLGKDEKRADMAEYSNDEWARVLSKLSPKDAKQWRAYCLLALAGLLGPRQKALRHLTWADVDLGAREVTWRAQYDKMGKERTQPLPPAAVRLLRIARVWRARDKYDGPWVFYPIKRGQSGPYHYSSVMVLLRQAEKDAGVKHVPYRGLHGLRRTAAGNVMAVTGGDLKSAGDWIGDVDAKALRRYLKVRDGRQKEVAGMMGMPEADE